MKISELIEELFLIKDDFGNLNVTIFNLEAFRESSLKEEIPQFFVGSPQDNSLIICDLDTHTSFVSP